MQWMVHKRQTKRSKVGVERTEGGEVPRSVSSVVLSPPI